ncbi:hypothetical protein VOLCADRAFT_83092 [Volvox carteri f. nagariensis]|uniref:L-dopachrome isomerase n=1 Tax=Volvox carteri f. nagariensis TaxID=3068 RepID=D8U966_VOLCA|nr:uncharacterized protein VOLCADRAFT_83092 [Volvox carteri f. nagariensis]EFJ43698.1 hypothetical protein VOLCADRAFT_83092 [Volvox carteri f. nagariensis]|eukprot:XP_002955179.1 hypothetical protein VOLCADRAFT_83092 [Volvox carteri f. nagariensis]
MPTLNVITNVPCDRVTSSDVLKALSKAVSKSVGKPEQWVMCSLTTDKPMIYGGSEEPCAFGYFMSIGAIGGDVNQPNIRQISAAICEVLSTHLGVPAARVYIEFSDVNASDVGWNGSTFV